MADAEAKSSSRARLSMRNRKIIGDMTQTCGTPVLVGSEEEQSLSTTTAINRSERKLEVNRKTGA